MTTADDTAHAAKTIEALVDALEKIESDKCNWPQEWGCIVTGYPRERWCHACVAHEALTLFRRR